MQPKEAQVFEKESKKEGRFTTPAEQWDQLAFTLMYQELAPKGFKKFTNGHWRGAEHADIPFLSKKTVQKCQKISAQLVRGFREKVREGLQIRLRTAIRLQEDAIKERDKCYFWQFQKRKEYQRQYEHFRDHQGLILILVNEIDNTSIK